MKSKVWPLHSTNLSQSKLMTKSQKFVSVLKIRSAKISASFISSSFYLSQHDISSSLILSVYKILSLNVDTRSRAAFVPQKSQKFSKERRSVRSLTLFCSSRRISIKAIEDVRVIAHCSGRHLEYSSSE